jgi:hypothetical protein
MAMTTSQLRAAWGPACAGTKVSLAEAYRHLDICFQRWSYRIRPGVTGAYNCRRITGGTGYSLHAFGPGGIFTFWTGVRVTMALAVDCNWDRNPYSPRLITDMPLGMINDIVGLRTNNGQQVWGWGGHYGKNKDSMHMEVVCSPASLATGIAGGGGLPAPAPEEPPPAASVGVTMFVVISGVACVGLANNAMFTYKDWPTFLAAKAASTGCPMLVIPDSETLEARNHYYQQLFAQHVNAVKQPA